MLDWTFANRTFRLTGCIRQRKELGHPQLIAEVIQQLNSRFLADVTMVKKRIESLIEREYLARIEDSERPAYRYLV